MAGRVPKLALFLGTLATTDLRKPSLVSMSADRLVKDAANSGHQPAVRTGHGQRSVSPARWLFDRQ